MAAPIVRVNSGITFEQSHFSKLYELKKTILKYSAESNRQRSSLKQLERHITDLATPRQTTVITSLTCTEV